MRKRMKRGEKIIERGKLINTHPHHQKKNTERKETNIKTAHKISLLAFISIKLCTTLAILETTCNNRHRKNIGEDFTYISKNATLNKIHLNRIVTT